MKGWDTSLERLLENATPEIINHTNNDGINLVSKLLESEKIDILIKFANYSFFDKLVIGEELSELILKYDHIELLRVYINKIENTYDLLYQAIKLEKKPIANFLLESGKVKIDSRLLFLAIAIGQIELVSKLAEHGVELNAHGKYGDTPIQYAILKDRKEITEFLLTKDINLELLDKDGNSLLHLVMPKGWINVIEKLSKVLPLNQKNSAGETPLLTYLKYSKTISKSTIDILLENGARIDVVDNEGTSIESLAKNNVSILEAVKNSDDTRVKLLIERGGDINKALHQLVDEYVFEPAIDRFK
jgi:ankyrin repeat protein